MRRSIGHIWRHAWLAMLPLAALPTDAAGQEGGALLKADIVRMLTTGGYTVTEVGQIVRMSCVSFAPTSRDREDLGRLTGGDEVLTQIDECRKSGQAPAAGYRQGIPRAVPVKVASTRPRRGASLADTKLPDEVLHAPELPPPALTMVQSKDLALASAESPPKLLNWSEVSRRLLEAYRPDRRKGGTVVVRVLVDEEGEAREPKVQQPSGDPHLDNAVLATVSLMRFSPAMSRDRKVASWTDLPIRFETP